MSIEIEIGIYSDDDKKNAIPQKNKFESVQELRAYLDFAKEGYNTDPLLLVQLGEGKQPFLLDKDSNFALNEFIKEV
ncbi:MAG: hypothetical protein Q4G08_10405, partial [Capnocytophaga sp.]|nr:hypothetical protein [Capnocytophaga sp.]